MRHVAAVAAIMAGLSAAAAHADTPCQVATIAELPVTMAGLSPLVHAKINGKEAVFEADTGAWYSMMSPSGAAEAGLKLQAMPPGFMMGGVGGTFHPSYTTVKTFTLAGVDIPKVEFLVGGTEFGSVGLLGQNVLAVADTEIDLAHGMIRLMRSKGCARANLAYWVKPNEPYSLLPTEETDARSSHIIATITVNGQRLRAVFDTGANNSTVTLAAAARIGLRPDGPGVTPGGSVLGLGRAPVRSWLGQVADVKIGDEEIRNTRLRFGGTLTDTDVLIGADFFLSHHVYWSKEQRKLFFTYNGGHVFDLRYLRGDDDAAAPIAVAAAPPDGPAPVDAAGFDRRGAARAARGDLQGGIADLGEAIRLAPDDADLLRQRAQIYARQKQYGLALDDVDAGLKHAPDDIQLLLMRIAIRLRQDHHADVRVDLDRAAKIVPAASEHRLAIAELYQEVDALPEAVAQFDGWLATHPDDARRGAALNGRCWSRALMGKALDLALKDCNAALSLSEHAAGAIDSRALVRLRMGDYARAVADYDAALAKQPGLAWSLYGRGVAEERLGQKPAGEADIAKARAIDAEVPARAEKLGIAP